MQLPRALLPQMSLAQVLTSCGLQTGQPQGLHVRQAEASYVASNRAKPHDAGANPPDRLVRIVGARILDAFREPTFSIPGLYHGGYNIVKHTRNFLFQVQTSVSSLAKRAADKAVQGHLAV